MAKDLSRFIEQLDFPIERADAGLRLDHFIMGKIFWRSRSDLQQRIKKGSIFVNEKPAKAACKLALGDVVSVRVTEADFPDQNPEKIAINVLFENDDVIVINKQPGLLVHPTGKHIYDTMMNALHLRYRRSGAAERGIEPHIVHRLDRSTSGVLIVAKTLAVKQELQTAFESRDPRKEYLAIVHGRMTEDRGTVDVPIGPDEESHIRLLMKVRPDGLRSLSDWEVVERFQTSSLVRVIIKTGRQHQIRVHMAHIGHPLFCDPLYGDPRSLGLAGQEPILERQALHAERLTITLPGEDEPRCFRAELPEDMQQILDALQAGAELVPGPDNQSERWAPA